MEIQSKVKELVSRYGQGRENLIPILQELCQKKRYLSPEVMSEVALQMELSAAEVYGTASFYSFLDLEKRGENVIRVCRTISCEMSGENDILAILEKRLNIKVGQTTFDNKFSLLETNCLGHCHQGPVMLINDQVYTNLTPEKVISVIENYSNSEERHG